MRYNDQNDISKDVMNMNENELKEFIKDYYFAIFDSLTTPAKERVEAMQEKIRDEE